MKKKGIITVVLAGILTLASTISSFAGEWRQDNVGWWWQEDDGSYPVDEWQYINGKYYYFDKSGYMLHDTKYDGIELGSDGARVISDLGLEEAPYKAQLDEIINEAWNNYKKGVYVNSGSTANGISIDFIADKKSSIKWIDCGDYYKVNGVIILGFSYNNGDYEDWSEIGTLDELRVRKDAVCIYNKETTLTAEQWINNDNIIGVSFGTIFDNKGYLVSTNISYAS